MNACVRTRALVIAAAAATIFSSCQGRSQPVSCLVASSSGNVQGLDLGASCAFLGIPYAAPAVDNLRWKPPQPARDWKPATLNATSAPPICPQVSPEGSSRTVGSEDCLTLNIWAPSPAPASPASVIVWIPAGGFTSESANLLAEDVQRISRQRGAIVVAMNYRVGPFGFLAHNALTSEDPTYRSSGNYGLLDQRAALAWIRTHIAAFGGNPSEVTIAGQSAGAHSVSLHVVSPGSADYFTRAIMESGYASTRWRTLEAAESLGRDFAAALGCTEPAHVLACMRSKTLEQLLLALPTGEQQFAETARAPWGPIVDGLEIPDQPRTLYEKGVFAHVPLGIGTTSDEGWAYVDRSFPAALTREVYEAEVEAEFGTADAPAIRKEYPLDKFQSPKHALAQIAGDVEAVCEARRVARLIGRTKTPVSLYSYEREGDAPELVFGNTLRPSTNHVHKEREAPCDFWDRFFFGSVAGSAPASQP